MLELSPAIQLPKSNFQYGFDFYEVLDFFAGSSIPTLEFEHKREHIYIEFCPAIQLPKSNLQYGFGFYGLLDFLSQAVRILKTT